MQRLPKCYVSVIEVDGEKYIETDTSLWQDATTKLSSCSRRLRQRVLLTYIMYKSHAPKEAMPSPATVWRHKKIWEKAGFI